MVKASLSAIQGTPTSGYSTFLPQRWQIHKIMKNYGLNVTIVANTGGEQAYEQIKKGVGMCTQRSVKILRRIGQYFNAALYY